MAASARRTIDTAPDRPRGREVVVVVAAREEAARIGATLAGLRRAFPGAALWVADDASGDATAEIATAFGARVVRRRRRSGKGAAMGAAVSVALAAAGARDAVFVLCDGDLAESAQRLAPLADAAAPGRLAVAAFAVRAGGGLGVAVGFARWAIRRTGGVRASAPLSGQRAIGADELARLLPFADGYAMELGMTIDALRDGLELVEPVLELSHRAHGRTPAGFAHRARQLLDLVRAYASRR